MFRSRGAAEEARDLATPLLADYGPGRGAPARRNTGPAAMVSATPPRLMSPRTPALGGGSARPRGTVRRAAPTLHESLDFEACLNSIAAAETTRPLR